MRSPGPQIGPQIGPLFRDPGKQLKTPEVAAFSNDLLQKVVQKSEKVTKVAVPMRFC